MYLCCLFQDKQEESMKIFYAILSIVAVLGIMFSSCGKDDPDEPVNPNIQRLESEHGVANDTYLIYDIDLRKDSSSIYVHNAVFSMGETSPMTLNIRVDAPCTVDLTGKVFTFAGTGIVPNLMRGNTPVPISTLHVNNLRSVVDIERKTYSISFDCKGSAMGRDIDGHYNKEGKLK